MGKRRIRTSAERFQQVVSDMRDFQIHLGRQMVFLKIETPGWWDSTNPPFDLKERGYLCDVRIPYTIARELFTLDGMVCVEGLGEKSRQLHWDRNSDEFKELRRLFREAGAALPVSYREVLSGYCPWDVQDPASDWVALMLFRAGATAYDGPTPVIKDGRVTNYCDWHSFEKPIECSCRLIVELGLDTDSPVQLVELDTEKHLELDTEKHREGDEKVETDPVSPEQGIARAAEQEQLSREQTAIALRRMRLLRELKPNNEAPAWVKQAIEEVARTGDFSWAKLERVVGRAASTIQQSPFFGKHPNFEKVRSEMKNFD